MGKFTAELKALVSQDVIITTSVNEQLHGNIIGVDDDCVAFQMTDQKRYINVRHIIYVVPKESIAQ